MGPFKKFLKHVHFHTGLTFLFFQSVSLEIGTHAYALFDTPFHTSVLQSSCMPSSGDSLFLCRTVVVPTAFFVLPLLQLLLLVPLAALVIPEEALLSLPVEGLWIDVADVLGCC